MPLWLFPVVAAPFVGSFLGTVIERLPANESPLGGRSHCRQCGTVLPVRHLVPILSWAWLRGRCGFCRGRLGWFHPGVECAALLIALLAAAFDAGDPVQLWFDCAFGWTLLVAAWIDLDHLWLPDTITLPLVLAGLAATAWRHPESLSDHALAAALGYVAFRAVSLVYQRLRSREGLGEGDAKLVAAAGAWLGLTSLSWLILVGALAALAAVGIAAAAGHRVRSTTAIPFGPFLAAAGFGFCLYHPGAL